MSTTLLAETESERQQQEQELQKVREKIQQLQSKIKQDRAREGELEKKLRSVETRLGKVQRSVQGLKQSIKNNKNRLSTLKKQHVQLQQKLQQQRDMLVQQLRSAYASGNREQIKLLLNQEDPAALGRLNIYFDYINKARIQQIEATQATMQELLVVGSEIEEKNTQLNTLQAQHEAQLTSLKSNRNTRQKVLEQAQARLQQEDQKLKQLNSNKKQIEGLIASLVELLSDVPDEPIAQKHFAQLKGKLAWPTKGNKINQFGTPRGVGSLKWHGIMLDAPAGRQVHAVASGRVAFADWLRGFGLLIIIDHDNGYLSLYGHNSVLFAEAGDWIGQGQIISQVGDSGGLAKAGLYFELRHNGKPVNPAIWCVKSRR